MKNFMLLDVSFKILIGLGLLWGSPIQVSAQRVVWEQRLSWPGQDELTGLVDLEDGTYLACGTQTSRAVGTPPDSYLVTSIVRLTAQGDTLYCRASELRSLIGTPRMGRLSTGHVFVFGLAEVNGVDRLSYGIADPIAGSIHSLGFAPGFGNYAPAPASVTEGPDGSVLVCGSSLDSLGFARSVGCIARYDTAGNLIWATYIREHPDYTLLNHVEMTGQGTILVSGTAGSRIWAAELDEDGRELRRATFYATPSRILFDQSAKVHQAPGGRYIVTGRTQASRSLFYLGLHQGWAGGALWGGEQVGSSKALAVEDGSLFVQTSTRQGAAPALGQFSRLSQDSLVLWQIDRSTRLGSEGVAMNAVMSLQDSSAILAGFGSWAGNLDFYLARIANVGVPYRPWTPTATRFLAHQPMPVAYPNPTTGSLRFTGLAAPATLHLYGTDGRRVLGQSLQAGQAADLSALPPGLYQYRLTAKGKAWRGRIVKR